MHFQDQNTEQYQMQLYSEAHNKLQYICRENLKKKLIFYFNKNFNKNLRFNIKIIKPVPS
jgi:hypothetical protein